MIKENSTSSNISGGKSTYETTLFIYFILDCINLAMSKINLDTDSIFSCKIELHKTYKHNIQTSLSYALTVV